MQAVTEADGSLVAASGAVTLAREDTAPAQATVIASPAITWEGAESIALPESPPSFAAALLVVTPLAPFAVALSLGTLYVSPGAANLLASWGASMLMVGVGLGLVVSLVIAAVYCYVLRGTAVDQANATAYTEQCHRLMLLTARASVHAARPQLSETELSACRQVDASQLLARQQLVTPGLRWVLGIGYTTVWSLIPRGEEALMLVEPRETVVDAASYDQLRLEDSTMPMRKVLQDRLTAAIKDLSGDRDSVSARLTISQVRSAINQFRDDSREALVRSRNHVMGTLLVTGFTAMVLFSLAVISQPGASRQNLGSDPVVAAGVVFLVGALIGLFGRLNNESATDNAVEDYGLTVARLALTPVLSGLAAEGGVMVIALLPLLFNATALAPSADRQIQSEAVRAIPDLNMIYNLHSNPLGVGLAAMFGLTPSLLVGALQRTAESAKAGLKSTTATTTTNNQPPPRK